MKIWTGRKGHFNYLVHKHFGDLELRFSVMLDSDIFLKGEDESIWNRVRKETEHLHVFFDMKEFLDIPVTVPKIYFEMFLLRGFRDAIKNGMISITKKPEYTDNKTAVRAQADKVEKRKKGIEDAFKFAKTNKFDNKQITAKLPQGMGSVKKNSIN